MDTQRGVYIRKLVITAALGALAVFLGISRLGFFPWFSGATITVLHIPAIIGAIVEGPFVGLGIGTIFGISSLLQANIAPISPTDLIFRNPVVSLLPRMIFPIITWAIFYVGKKWKKIPAVIIAAITGTLIHTLLVLGAIILTNGSGILTGGDPNVTVWAVLGMIFMANGIPEAAGAAILTVIVVAVQLGYGNRKKSRLTSE